KGNYRLVAIAHNGTGAATISSPEKITFPNNKCTDTFYICEDFSVSDNSEFDLTLKRAVAMFRFVVEDAFPENIHQMKFYYTGGSSTFDATTGYGCVNSKQTEYREINDEMGNNEKQFDLFTFPHAEEDTLKMTITALSSTDVTIKERNFTSIPVKKNYITQYSGTFFDSTSSEGDLNIHFQVDTTWIQYSHRY
ncbi:MAG: FimB/Mfa2 family fimbrial subunit, partial [Prevotella sp.]|nr:FimB/Mfa2 family fimbrial subunit [Prevotella sp.]